jgi:UDP-N-acetylglucosamine diphosphorylase/glucosamine-1-phosphate N-acetyltransferase
VTPPLYLLEPSAPAPHWLPFAGVRPVCELRAGAWRIRERWEGALGLASAGILGAHVAGFHEFDEPAVRTTLTVDGPAVIAASWFAPSGAPPEFGGATRRLVHDGTTVAWVVPEGARWEGPDDVGEAAEIEGLLLEGAWDLITALEHLLPADCADAVAQARVSLPDDVTILGDPSDLVVLDAAVEPGVVFDLRHGPVVIEAGAEVRSGTRLEGPCFVGPGARVLGGFIRHSVLGPRAVVRGEVAASVFLGYANKAHDGFVGHSVLGHWVNLGAGTTTSNLKNTYGEVRLELPGGKVATGRQFLGTIFGDHAKTAIGTMLTTGTIVGAGANVFGDGAPPKYIPPMSWGHAGRDRMREEGFLAIAERVLPRRDVEFTPARRAALETMYRRVTG